MAKVEVEESTELVKRYYIDYAKYVLETRALPSIYDGLKFSQRRLVYVASKSGTHFSKSSKILGDTIPYHPHSLDSLYGVLVNLTTNMNRYRLFEGKGNWGGVGFDAAAYRYTEAYLNEFARYAYTQFVNSADFVEGESGLDEPSYLPALIPYSLLMGAQGIGVGLATSIMPLDAMDLIDYYIAVIKGEPTKTPTPDLGNYVLDMTDSEIDKAVEGAEGTLKVRSIVSTESDSVVVLDDLYNKTIQTLVKRLGDWIGTGMVDFRDETTTRPRYVFEVMDKRLTAKELSDRLSSMTKTNKTFTRLVVDGKVAVYSPLRHQVEKSLEYLNHVLDRKFSEELSKLEFDEQVLLAIKSIRESGLLERVPSLTTNQFKREVISLGYERNVVDVAVSKSMTYLTKSHDDELRAVRKKIRENKSVDRTEYLVSLYEGLREVIRPFYESSPHTVRRSRLLRSPRFALADGPVIRVSNKGSKYDGIVYAIRADGTGRAYHVGASVARDVPLESTDDNPVIALVSDLDPYVAMVTDEGRALVADVGRAAAREVIKLDEDEHVTFACGLGESEDGSMTFRYRRKAYDGRKFYRQRKSAPVPLGRPVGR